MKEDLEITFASNRVGEIAEQLKDLSRSSHLAAAESALVSEGSDTIVGLAAFAVQLSHQVKEYEKQPKRVLLGLAILWSIAAIGCILAVGIGTIVSWAF